MMHAADFGAAPSVALFITTKAAEFGFLVGPHVAIEAPSADAVRPEHVAAAIESLLVRPQQRAVWTL
jgi:hypothetical protein